MKLIVPRTKTENVGQSNILLQGQDMHLTICHIVIQISITSKTMNFDLYISIKSSKYWVNLLRSVQCVNAGNQRI